MVTPLDLKAGSCHTYLNVQINWLPAEGGVLLTRVTLKDVAVHAGVSHQTVSNVLNGHPSIRPTTRDRVLASIAQLDYHPNLAAKALREARVTTLCCALYGHDVEFISDPYRNLVQSAFVAEANLRGYSMTTAFLDGRQPASIDALRQRYLQRQFAGVVVVGTTLTADQWAQMQDWGVRTVLFDHHLPGTDAVTISANYDRGMADLVTHHASQGRRHLALILPLGDPGSTSVGRHQGFVQATEDLGLTTSVADGDWTFESGYAAMRALWADARPDAVLAGNDRMAAGALRAAHDLGLQVPHDVAISGFDDFDFALYTNPALTTMHIPHGDMARQAVRSLLELVETDHSPQSQVFPLTLVVRESA